MYTKNYKTLKKTKEEINTWRDIPRSWIRRLNLVKMAVFPKFIYNATPIKISASLFEKRL